MRRPVEFPANQPKPVTEIVDDPALDLVVNRALDEILRDVENTPRQREVLDEILTTYITDRSREGLWFALRRLGQGKLPTRITIPAMQYIVNNPPKGA